MAKGGLGQDGHVIAQVREGVDLVGAFHPVDDVGGHGDGPLGLLVAGVAHVHDLVALPGPGLNLVVDLGDQRAHGVHRVATHLVGPAHHLWRRTVGREHHRCPIGNLVDVVHEDHAESLKAFHHQLVVNDLVVAVDGHVEGPHQPRQSFDGHLHPGAEAPGFGQ